METMNVVDARRNFSEVMARVAYQRQRVVIERKGRPMMALISVEDLHRLEALEHDAGDTRTRRTAALAAAAAARARSAPSAAASPCPTPARPWPSSERSAANEPADLR